MPCGRACGILSMGARACVPYKLSMRVLFLSTWFPYPLSQGSKIRAYYLLRALAGQHDVCLISFADTQIQPEWTAHLSHLCSRVEIVERNPFSAGAARSFAGKLSLRPSTVVSTHSPEMADRARRVAAEWRPDCVVGLTFVTAPYALQTPGVPAIVDVDNLLSHMLYESYRNQHGGLRRLRAWLAWWKFRRYERELFQQFDAGIVVSQRDQRELGQLLPVAGRCRRIEVIANGVDLERNIAGLAAPVPGRMVFSGALSYHANYDAMQYFIGEVLPRIQAVEPAARLYITGRTDQVDLHGLAMTDRVVLTGYLDDVRPAVASAQVSVAPLRIGAGTRLKILEAMALGTPVVSTAKAAEGLEVDNGRHLFIEDTPEGFSRAVVALLRNSEQRESLIRQARQLVEDKYDWRAIGMRLCTLVDEVCQAHG